MVGNMHRAIDPDKALSFAPLLKTVMLEQAGKTRSDSVSPFEGGLPGSEVAPNVLSKALDGAWGSVKDTWGGLSPTAKTIVGGVGAAALALPAAKLIGAVRGRSSKITINDGSDPSEAGNVEMTPAEMADMANMNLLTGVSHGMNADIGKSLPLSSMLPTDMVLSTLALGRAYRSRNRFVEWVGEPEVMRGDVESLLHARVPSFGVGADGVVVFGDYDAYIDVPFSGGAFSKALKKAKKAASKGLATVGKLAKVAAPIAGFIPGGAMVTGLVSKAADVGSSLLKKAPTMPAEPPTPAQAANVESLGLPSGANGLASLAQSNPTSQQAIARNIAEINASPAASRMSPVAVPSTPGYTERDNDAMARIYSRNAEQAYAINQQGVPNVPSGRVSVRVAESAPLEYV